MFSIIMSHILFGIYMFSNYSLFVGNPSIPVNPIFFPVEISKWIWNSKFLILQMLAGIHVCSALCPSVTLKCYPGCPWVLLAPTKKTHFLEASTHFPCGSRATELLGTFRMSCLPPISNLKDVFSGWSVSQLTSSFLALMISSVKYWAFWDLESPLITDSKRVVTLQANSDYSYPLWDWDLCAEGLHIWFNVLLSRF